MKSNKRVPFFLIVGWTKSPNFAIQWLLPAWQSSSVCSQICPPWMSWKGKHSERSWRKYRRALLRTVTFEPGACVSLSVRFRRDAMTHEGEVTKESLKGFMNAQPRAQWLDTRIIFQTPAFEGLVFGVGVSLRAFENNCSVCKLKATALTLYQCIVRLQIKTQHVEFWSPVSSLFLSNSVSKLISVAIVLLMKFLMTQTITSVPSSSK